MARSTPQSFQKRQRERRNQEKAAEKFERRLIRNEEKRRAKAEGDWPPADYEEGAEGEGVSEETPEEGDAPQAE